MGARQLALIQPEIAKVYNAPTDDWCATFEIPNTELWVQIIRGSLNATYPHAEDPLTQCVGVVELLPDAELAEWEAGTFATFSHSASTPENLADAVDAMFAFLLDDEAADYELNSTTERL